MRSRRKWVNAAVAAAAVACVCAAANPPPVLFDMLRKAAGWSSRVLARRMLDAHGVVFYADMEGRLPSPTGTEDGSAVFDCSMTAGRYGGGRRLGGSSSSALSLPASWNCGGQESSFSFWIKPDPAYREHMLWRVSGGGAEFSCLITDGQLVLTYRDGAGSDGELRCPFDLDGKFSNIVLSFGEKKAAIFVNGREAASADIVNGVLIPGKQILFFVETATPFRGALDDFAVWNKALTAEDASRLSSSAGSLSLSLCPWTHAFTRLVRFASAAVPETVRVFDRLNPFRAAGTLFSPEIPAVSISMSKKDSRVFLREHENSLMSGFRTSKGASPRQVSVSAHGRTAKCEIMLDDVYTFPEPSKRPSFVLCGTGGAVIDGEDTVRIMPPETWGETHPDGCAFMPDSVNSIRRLFVNGEFRGVYCVVPFRGSIGGWAANGVRSAQRPDMANYTNSPCVNRVPYAQTFPGEAAKVRAAILSDVRFPWSLSETKSRERLWKQNRDKLDFKDCGLSEFDLLGSNESPLFVTGDLDLSPVGDGCIWKSSRPDLISSNGKTARPGGDLPVEVQMECTYPGGGKRTFRFRVMPEKHRLPVFVFDVATPLRKDRRCDFLCRFYPGDGSGVRHMTGLTGNGSGLKHRGNTSYVKGRKRSMSAEFDEPHAITGPPGAEHINFLCGYSDQTRMRNAFCYEIFSRAEELHGVPRRSVTVNWCEIFINGAYCGVWEFCGRPDALLIPESDIFKMTRPEDPFVQQSLNMTRQIVPKIPGTDASDAIDDAAAFMKDAGTARFAAEAGRFFDIDNAAAFMLTLNYSQNFDGRITNHFICRAHRDGRIFFIPWDYDKTFMQNGVVRLSNLVLDRLTMESPQFRSSLAGQWSALREDVLSETNVAAWIDRHEALLAPYMQTEFSLSVPFEGQSSDYASAVKQFRECALARLRTMDVFVKNICADKSAAEE